MIKTKTKTFLIILITLIIGIAIGFEVSEILIRKRFDEFKNLRQPKGFVGIFENMIKPDENQKPILDSIILKFHKRINNTMAIVKMQMDKQIDSLSVELKPYLTKEQMDRFKNEMMRMKKSLPPDSMIKGPFSGPMKNGPPPGFDRNGPPPGFDGKNLPPPPPQDR